MGNRRQPKTGSGVPDFHDDFLWDMPWIRTNRFSRKPWSFSGRIVLGFILGLLLGRVIGSLQGILGQWIFQSIDGWLNGFFDETIGRVLYILSLVLGTILKPLLGHTPMEKSLEAVRSTHSGYASVLFLAQLHGTANGLYQGLKPAFGYKLNSIIEAIILPWGRLWSWVFLPFKKLFWPVIDRKTLAGLLRNVSRAAERKRLMRYARMNRLPDHPTPEFWTERETVLSAPSGPAKEKREDYWWRNPAFRVDTYRWLGSTKEIRGFPLLVRGLADPDTGARRQAVHSMAELQSPIALHPLIGLLTDDDGEVRNTAEKGLKEMNTDMGQGSGAKGQDGQGRVRPG